MSYRAIDIENLLAVMNLSALNSGQREQLAAAINDCILTDFDKLLQLLYRLDIDEMKLRALLKDIPGQDAGLIIADLIVERQVQKIKSRQQFSRRDNDISEEDKW
jgi:hypothetical protein